MSEREAAEQGACNDCRPEYEAGNTSRPPAENLRTFEQWVLGILRRAYRLEASYEYPGFIQIVLPDEYALNTGTANPTWTIDTVDFEGHAHGFADTGISIERRTIQDAYDVAEAIAKVCERAGRRYWLVSDGLEEITYNHLLHRENSEDAELLTAIDALESGQALTIGGGAMPITQIRRM